LIEDINKQQIVEAKQQFRAVKKQEKVYHDQIQKFYDYKRPRPKNYTIQQPRASYY